jgi:phospholipid transport system substrate-binding protein
MMNIVWRASLFCCAVWVSSLIGGGVARSDTFPTQAVKSPRQSLSEPARSVAAFLDSVFTLFRSRDIAPNDRQAMLRRLIETQMDIPALAAFMTDARLGQTAADLQRRFQRLLVDYLVAGYGRMIEAAATTPFDIVVENPLADGTAVVTTIFHRPGSSPEPISWHLLATNGAYRIVDVVADGVSLAVTQRSVFLSVMRDGGLPLLITKLEAHSH